MPIGFLKVRPVVKIYDGYYCKDVTLDTIIFAMLPGAWNQELFYTDLKTIIARRVKGQFPFRQLRSARLPYDILFSSIEYTTEDTGEPQILKFSEMPYCSEIPEPSTAHPYVVTMQFRIQDIHAHILRPLLDNHEDSSDSDVDMLTERFRLIC